MGRLVIRSCQGFFSALQITTVVWTDVVYSGRCGRCSEEHDASIITAGDASIITAGERLTK